MRTSLSRPVRAIGADRPKGRYRKRWLLGGLAVLALASTACSQGPGDEDDLVTALTHNDAFSTAEAECVAAAVFDEYGEDEEAITRISGATSYEELTNTTDGVQGFDDFFRRAVSACTNT